jgi:D-sedoheptulose 7-phosphate isomerase
MNQKITASCSQLQGLLEDFCQQQGNELNRLAQQLGALFASGGQLLLAGGAAFQPVVQLLAGHFTYRLGFDRPALPAIALGSDPMLTAAMANCGMLDQHLVRHYRALNSDNHLLLIFNDGSSSAALRALRDEALDNDRPVALMTVESQSDPLCRDGVDICIDLGTALAPRQLELSLFAGQLLCELVEAELFGV